MIADEAVAASFVEQQMDDQNDSYEDYDSHDENSPPSNHDSSSNQGDQSGNCHNDGNVTSLEARSKDLCRQLLQVNDELREASKQRNSLDFMDLQGGQKLANENRIIAKLQSTASRNFELFFSTHAGKIALKNSDHVVFELE